jgi:hypothetical protein
MYFYIKSGSLVKIAKGNEDFTEQDGTRHGEDIFTKWSEAELNAKGLYKINVIKPTLLATQKYNGFTDDYVAMTRTYNVVDKTQAQLDNDIKNAERKVYHAAKSEIARVDKKAMRITIALVDALIAKGTIAMADLPLPVREIITDRKSRRAALPADPDPVE